MYEIYDGCDGVRSETLLGALDKAMVFNVGRVKTGLFRIQESCDRYFYAILTREQMLALADELRAMAAKGSDEES